MKQILYLLKQADPDSIEMIQAQASMARIEVVLIQDAVSMKLQDIPASVLADDAQGEIHHATISYKALLEKIFKADTVITW